MIHDKMKFSRAICPAIISMVCFLSISASTDIYPTNYIEENSDVQNLDGVDSSNRYVTTVLENGQRICFHLESDVYGDWASVSKSPNAGEWNYKGNVIIPSNINYEGKEYIVDYIESGAMLDCPALESVELPSTIWDVHAENFYLCPNLKSIGVAADNKFLSSIDGALYSKGGVALMHYPCAAAVGIIKLPEITVDIEERAFSHCVNLKGMEFGPNISWFGKYSFYNSGIEEIYIPENASFQQDSSKAPCYAFANCINLKKVVFPEKIEIIPKYCFQNSGLTDIVFPKDCLEIQTGVFSNNPIKEVVIPYISGYVEYLSPSKIHFFYYVLIPDAFIDCPELEKITTSVELDIKGNGKLKTLYLENSASLNIYDISPLRNIYIEGRGNNRLYFKTDAYPTEEQKSKCTIHTVKGMKDTLIENGWEQLGTIVEDYDPSSVEEIDDCSDISDEENCSIYTIDGKLTVNGIRFGEIQNLDLRGMYIVRSLESGKSKLMAK